MDCAKRGLGQKVSLVSDRTIKDSGISIFFPDHNPRVSECQTLAHSDPGSHATRLEVPF